jgi:hypothetical protein
MLHRSSSILSLCALALGVALTSCDDGGTDPNSQLSGEYDLLLVNEAQLPFTVGQGGFGQTRIISGQLVFEKPDTLVDIRVYQGSGAGGTQPPVTETARLPYQVRGNLLIVDHPVGASYADTGTINDNTITLKSRHSGALYRNVNLRMIFVK